MQSSDKAYDLITLLPAGTLPIISPAPAVDASEIVTLGSLGYKVLFILFPNYFPLCCCDITRRLGLLFLQIQYPKSNAEARARRVNLSRLPSSKPSPNTVFFLPTPLPSSLSLPLHLTTLGPRHFPGCLYWPLRLYRRDIWEYFPLRCWAAPSFYPHGRSSSKPYSSPGWSSVAVLS